MKEAEEEEEEGEQQEEQKEEEEQEDSSQGMSCCRGLVSTKVVRCGAQARR